MKHREILLESSAASILFVFVLKRSVKARLSMERDVEC